MPTRLEILAPEAFAEASTNAETLVLAGRKARLLDPAVRALLPPEAAEAWAPLVEAQSPGDAGCATSTWTARERPRKIVAVVLPEACSRHNSPARPHALAAQLTAQLPAAGEVTVVLALEAPEHAFAATLAVARALPRYGRKSGPRPDRVVRVGLLPPGEPLAPSPGLAQACESVRRAAELVDMPAAELNTDGLLEEARGLANELDVPITIIRGDALAKAGLGGLAGVGRAALRPPALVVLSHAPASATRTVAWVGKGIVYDTGGLSLKPREGMVGMKKDMAGAAAVLWAFAAAVRAGCPDRLHAILCLAENAIGPEAVRPDDVLTLYSGRTVEINNTDAEGRLVLADGIAWAARHLTPDVIVDLATLTGAQLVSTGKRHAAIVCNDPELEAAAIVAGRASGELVHPLPFCPEFFRGEFKSDVADLKNSVKDRNNAQSACAAQFIAEHFGDWSGAWLHVDMAGPAEVDGRGTGFGVGLLLELAGSGTAT